MINEVKCNHQLNPMKKRKPKNKWFSGRSVAF